ncbi:MAG: hypothetical protein ACIAXF_01520 [Phycisphaerales bacterium JB063]
MKNRITTSILLALVAPTMLLGPGCAGTQHFEIPGVGKVENPFADAQSPIAALNEDEIKSTGEVLAVASLYASPYILEGIDHDETRAAASLVLPVAVMSASYVAADAVEDRRKRYENDIELLDEEIELAEKTLAAKSLQLAELEQAINTLKAEIDGLIEQAGNDEQARQKAVATRDTLKSEIEQHNAQLIRYNESIGYIEALEEEIIAANTATAELDERLVTLRGHHKRFVEQRDQLHELMLQKEGLYDRLGPLATGRE